MLSLQSGEMDESGILCMDRVLQLSANTLMIFVLRITVGTSICPPPKTRRSEQINRIGAMLLLSRDGHAGVGLAS